jgi:hypothetical protein
MDLVFSLQIYITIIFGFIHFPGHMCQNYSTEKAAAWNLPLFS